MTGGLWRERDFGRLWLGTAVSLFGSEFSLLAVPLTAVLVLGAGPWEMGLLSAARWAPYLLFGLVAGVWADRVRRRPLMIGTDLARAVLIGVAPAGGAGGGAAVRAGGRRGVRDGGPEPGLRRGTRRTCRRWCRREALVEGNSKLELARSSAQIVGPALAGGLVQARRRRWRCSSTPARSWPRRRRWRRSRGAGGRCTGAPGGAASGTRSPRACAGCSVTRCCARSCSTT